MKSIYAFIKNGGLFKLDQNPRVPSNAILSAPGISSNVEVDRSNLVLEENIKLNNINVPNMKSNRELYLELVDYLKQEGITEIETLYDHFQIYIDYSIWEGDHEIEHLAIIRPLKPIDKIMPLGVGKNNELVYRRVKTFNPVIEFGTRNYYPLGITQTNRKKYAFQIHNLAIFQATEKPVNYHGSLCDTPFNVKSKTLCSTLDGMVTLFSTINEGITIQEARVDFTPRILRLRLDIILADMVVAYSDDEIKSILENNLELKYPSVQPGEPIVPEEPKDDDNPDVNENPDDNVDDVPNTDNSDKSDSTDEDETDNNTVDKTDNGSNKDNDIEENQDINDGEIV